MYRELSVSSLWRAGAWSRESRLHSACVLGGRRSQQAHNHLPQAVGLTTCRATEWAVLRGDGLATGTAIFQPPAFRHRLPRKLEAEVSHRLGRAASRPCRRASRVAHLNNRIIPMVLVFFLLFLKVVLSDLQFSQGVVFFCWAASILLQYACTSFLSHTHSLGICTHTYTVTRASVTLARTHDPMLLSWQVFAPPFPWLNFPFPCFLSFCYGYFVLPGKKKKELSVRGPKRQPFTISNISACS